MAKSCNKDKRDYRILHGRMQWMQEENQNCWLANFLEKAHKNHGMQISNFWKTIF